MGSQRNTGAFVAGSVIGGLIGAAAVLWKTPKSGAELRAGFNGGSGAEGDRVTYRAEAGGDVERETRFSNPILSFVERAAAPIVGVELGKLAKDDPHAAATPVRTSSADARPPTTPGAAPVAGEPARAADDTEQAGFMPREPGVADATASGAVYTSPATAHRTDVATDVDTEDVVNPDEAATHDSDEGSTAHAATTEELTHPTGEYAGELREKTADTEIEGHEVDFPDLPSSDDTTNRI